jgi:hypothetical protein
MATSCSPGGTSAGAGAGDAAVGSDQDAGADFGHSALRIRSRMSADYIRSPTQPDPSEKGLSGGAIQLAGELKARGERRRVRSDWMALERERGITVSSAVVSSEDEGLAFNLLDTPGRHNFSPLGFQRKHLPHPDRGRQGGDGARRRPQWRQRGIEE